MTRMTNEEILKVYKGIADLIEAKIPLNIKVSYTLAKDKKLLTPYVEIIETERIKIYNKHGTQEDGNIVVAKENIPELEKDIKELMEVNNKVEITKILLSDFGENEIGIEILEELMPIIIDTV